ncbi:MAG: hypothetical protein ABTQ32_10855 [Myxococcaceae bacterium]
MTVRLKKDRWREGVEYLNPDDIAQERFGDWNSAEAVRAAATWAAARREELLASGSGIAFETVFSTNEKVDFLRRARAGVLRSCLLRDDQRPANQRCPCRGPCHAWRAHGANREDRCSLRALDGQYDNSEQDEDARLCARTESGQLRKVYGSLPTWVLTTTADLPRHQRFVDRRVA